MDWGSAPLVGIVHDEATPSMDPAIRDLLVAALKSSKYPQGYDRLRSIEDEYTALGVLCDLATKLGVCEWDRVEGEYFIAPLIVPATGAFIPQVVRDWAGIKETHPSQELPLMWQGNKHPIWRLTDLFKVPFAEVAELIRYQY